MVSQEDIRRMVDTLVERFHPEKVILFGSYARGTAGPDSDVDLLVVKDTAEDPREVAATMLTAVWLVPVAKDLIVRTPAQFEQENAVYWTVVHAAAKEGQVLYAGPS